MLTTSHNNKPGSQQRGTQGNVLIMGVMVIVLLMIVGIAMVSRMILDSNISAKMVLGTQAFYLADAGIQYGRRYLVFNSDEEDFDEGDMDLSIGDNTLDVEIDTTTVYYPDATTQINVYRITSTATVGPTTREIEELRWRGGGNDKDFLLWRETVADEF